MFLVDPVYKEFYDLISNVTVSAEDCSNSTVKMTSGLTSKEFITIYVKMAFQIPTITPLSLNLSLLLVQTYHLHITLRNSAILGVYYDQI